MSGFDRVMSAGLRAGQLRFGDAPERDVAIDFDAECAARPGEVRLESGWGQAGVRLGSGWG